MSREEAELCDAAADVVMAMAEYDQKGSSKKQRKSTKVSFNLDSTPSATIRLATEVVASKWLDESSVPTAPHVPEMAETTIDVIEAEHKEEKEKVSEVETSQEVNVEQQSVKEGKKEEAPKVEELQKVNVEQQSVKKGNKEKAPKVEELQDVTLSQQMVEIEENEREPQVEKLQEVKVEQELEEIVEVEERSGNKLLPQVMERDEEVELVNIKDEEEDVKKLNVVVEEGETELHGSKKDKKSVKNKAAAKEKPKKTKKGKKSKTDLEHVHIDTIETVLNLQSTDSKLLHDDKLKGVRFSETAELVHVLHKNPYNLHDEEEEEEFVPKEEYPGVGNIVVTAHKNAKYSAICDDDAKSFADALSMSTAFVCRPRPKAGEATQETSGMDLYCTPNHSSASVSKFMLDVVKIEAEEALLDIIFVDRHLAKSDGDASLSKSNDQSVEVEEILKQTIDYRTSDLSANNKDFTSSTEGASVNQSFDCIVPKQTLDVVSKQLDQETTLRQSGDDKGIGENVPVINLSEEADGKTVQQSMDDKDSKPVLVETTISRSAGDENQNIDGNETTEKSFGDENKE